MRTVEDRPAFQRPVVTRFGIPEPRKATPDIRHWVYSSPPDLSTIASGTGVSAPLYPTYGARLISVRAALKTAGSTDSVGILQISGFTVATFTIPASSRRGHVARPRLRARWDRTDVLEVLMTTVGTGATGPLTLVLDHVRPEL